MTIAALTLTIHMSQDMLLVSFSSHKDNTGVSISLDRVSTDVKGKFYVFNRIDIGPTATAVEIQRNKWQLPPGTYHVVISLLRKSADPMNANGDIVESGYFDIEVPRS